MAVSKAVYGDWKRHPVTHELMKELKSMMEDSLSRLIVREEPDWDHYISTRMYVRIADSVLNWQPEFLQEEEQDAQS